MTIALCPWKPVNGLLFEKELLPVGPVVKWVSGREAMNTNIELSFLERVVAQFNRFKEVGVRVPLFKTHIEDPDNDRGSVEKLFIRNNQAGQPSLYGHIRFSSEEYAAKGKDVDVSVMCPPSFVDGKGNAYEYPLRHVALTSIPVVPGLEPFHPIVFSFETESGLLPEGSADPIQLAAEEENLETAETGEEEPAEDLPAEDALILIANLVGADLSLGNQALVDAIALALGGEEGIADEEAEPIVASHEPTPIALSQRMLTELTDARVSRIQGLVTQSVISPALAEKFIKRYTTPAVIQLDFTAASDDQTRFDEALALAHEIANDRPIVKPAWRRQVSVQPDADSSDANLPATVRDAKRRAAAAQHKV